MLSMIVSTFLASSLFISQKLKFVLILIILVIFLIILICFAAFKKKVFIVIASMLLIALIPATSIYLKAKNVELNKTLISESNSFSGKIYKVSERLEKNRIYVYLDDVSIENNGDFKDFYGNIYVIMYADGVDTSKLDIGRHIKISNVEISCLTLNSGTDSYDRSFISKDITATTFAFSHNVYFEDKVSLDFRDKIKDKVYESFKNTDNFFTDIGYAMIFGESSAVEDSVYDVFKDSGVAHLLAVSGFHISVIVAFLSFVLNKLRSNKYLKIGIIGALLFAYMYLCSFSISVIRASIMALVLLHAGNRNKEYDKLSALSLAGIIILLINPMQLFSLSFIFSFVSILSIILLMPIFERFFSKIFYDKLSSSLSLSLAVSFGIVVFQLCYFGKFPVLGFLSNLITIPIVSVMFIYLIVSVIFGPMFHIIDFMISGFGFVMKYVAQFNSFISKCGVFLVSSNVSVITLFLWLALMFVVSDYVFMKKETRICVSGVIVSLLVALMIWCKWTRQKKSGLI